MSARFRIIFAAAVLVASFVLFSFHTVPILTFPHEVKYGESLMRAMAERVHGETGLYPSFERAPYLIDNYPPVYPYLVALFPSTIHAPYFGGRLVSVLSILLSAWAIALIVRERAGDAPAFLASAVFLATPEIIDFGMRMRVDSLALAFGLWGFHAILRPRSRWRFFGCLLFFLSIYTRHSMFVFPVAGFTVLLFREGRRSLPWPVGLLSAGVIAFLAVNWLTAGRFYEHLIDFNLLPYGQADVMSKWFGARFPWRLFLLLAAVFVLTPRLSRPFWKGGFFLAVAISIAVFLGTPFLHWLGVSMPRRGLLPPDDFSYLLGFTIAITVIGFVFGVLAAGGGEDRTLRRESGILLLLGLGSAAMIGRVGSDVNYLYEYTAVLCILAGWSAGRSDFVNARVPFIPLLVLIALISGSIDFALHKNTRQERLEEIGKRGETVMRLREIEGRILSLDPSLVVAAGHAVEYQPFMYRKLADLGVWDPEPLMREVREKRFAAVVWVLNKSFAGFEVRDGRNVPYFGPWTFNYYQGFPEEIRTLIREYYVKDPHSHRVVEKVTDLYYLGYEVWVPKRD